jgi:1-acyl-sn-glycerol-3-phosphate acyltransferase
MKMMISTPSSPYRTQNAKVMLGDQSLSFRPLAFKPHFAAQRYDQFDYKPATDADQAEKILKFTPPKPKKWVQKVMLSLNHLALPMVDKIKVKVDSAEIAKLKQLPKNAGVMMVGAHPDYADGKVMFELMGAVGQVPAGFFMASDVLAKKNFVVKRLLSWLGAIPIRRGKPNPEATDFLTNRIAQGGWGGVFPEGAIYFSRQVMPMEYGAVKMTVDAALLALEESEKTKKSPRPMFLQPFAHVYQHTSPEQMQALMEKRLGQIEALPHIFRRSQTGDIPTRIRSAARRILDSKVEEYGWQKELMDPLWKSSDAFARGERLENKLMEDLETRYLGKVSEGYVRRRAMKVRMVIYEQLKQKDLPAEQVALLKKDIQKTMDAITLVSFSKAYMESYNDTEMWGEILRRLRDAVDLSDEAFGDRQATVKVLPPIDALPWAKHFKTLQTDDEKKQYLFDLTETLRQQIQEGIDQLYKQQRQTLK